MKDLELVFEDVASYPGYWHLCGICLIVVLALLDTRAKRGGVLTIFFWNLPGVFLHELTHLCAGTILLAKPVSFHLLPRKRSTGWQLGAVTFQRLNAFNSLPVGLAPLGLVAVAYFIFTHWTHWFPSTLSSILGAYVALFFLVYNSIPSRQDIRVAFSLGSILVYGTVLFVLYEFFWT